MLLDRIREKSNPLHQELETVLNIPKQVNALSEYSALLQKFLALYEPWEKALLVHAAEFEKNGVKLQARLRCANLRADLEALGVAPLAPAPFASLPPVQDFAAAMGSLYVLEGSSLGGQMLIRLFAERLGLTPDKMRFFTTHGPEVGKMWKSFCRALNAYGETLPEEQQLQVTKGAADSFRSLIRWFGEEK